MRQSDWIETWRINNSLPGGQRDKRHFNVTASLANKAEILLPVNVTVSIIKPDCESIQ